MAEQLHFDLPARVAMGAEDYLVSEANRAAFEQVMSEAAWADGRLALTGPEGSGKSHLARIWAARARAQVHAAGGLRPDTPLPAPGSRVVVEDVDRIASAAEEYLFHLHNHLSRTGGALLVTGRGAPARWPIRLPDLASRLQAMPVARIDDPDDDLLRAVLLKHFADRQLNADPGLVDWLLRRMERSFAAAADLVAELDSRSLAQGRVINRSLARAILDKSCGDDE